MAELRWTWRTKVPVFGEHRDDIAGILHARDLLGINLENADRECRPLQEIVREPYIVLSSKPVSELFHTFRDRKLSVALVVDEFGGATDLVAIEDIEDEYDAREEPTQWIREISDREYLVSARIDIDTLREQLGIRFPDGNYLTLAGFLLAKACEMPAPGAVMEVDEVTFVIERASPRAIREVQIRLS